MYDLNNVSIVGRLTRTPDLKTGNDKSYSKFAIANNPGGKDNDASFFDVTIFGKMAENCNKFLEKGNLVAITGRLIQSRWVNKDGDKRSKVEIIANTVSFLSSPKNKENKNDETNYEKEETKNNMEDDIDDESVPF